MTAWCLENRFRKPPVGLPPNTPNSSKFNFFSIAFD